MKKIIIILIVTMIGCGKQHGTNIKTNSEYKIFPVNELGINFDDNEAVKVSSNVDDITFLKEFENIKYLSVVNSNVDDLSVINDLSFLKVVFIEGSKVKELVSDKKITVVYNPTEFNVSENNKNTNSGDNVIWISVDNKCQMKLLEYYIKNSINDFEYSTFQSQGMLPIFDNNNIKTGHVAFCERIEL